MCPPTHTFELTTQASSLAPFRKKLLPLLEKSGFDSKAIRDILLSVDESLTNIIRHAYGGENQEERGDKIRVSFTDFEDRAEILIEDQGLCFDPRKVPPPQLPSKKPGGLGIHLVRSLMDEIGYESLKPQGNRLRLVKYKMGKERNAER